MPTKRILILTPWAPYPVTGACQQDRFWGMKFMRDLGYDVRVIGRYHAFQDPKELKEAFDREGVDITLVPHRTDAWKLLLKNPFRVLTNPAWLDGSALEYADPKYIETVRRITEEFRPDIAWLEYCSHWPMSNLLHSYGIPTILKSSNNEAAQCMDDHDHSILSMAKAAPKYVSEWIVANRNEFVLAVSPDEERWYRRLGAKHITTLPLRGLSQCLKEQPARQKDVLDVVFLTSNYNMGHNRVIVEFVLRDVIPKVRAALHGKYRFHLTGRKFPEALGKYLGEDVRSVGYVPDIGEFMGTMDIALSPWITGQGMQQKVFEPLCRGIPTMTTKTGGYPFEDGKEILLCKTPEEYVAAFRMLQDFDKRSALGHAGFLKAYALFSEETVKRIMEETIETVLRAGKAPSAMMPA